MRHSVTVCTSCTKQEAEKQELFKAQGGATIIKNIFISCLCVTAVLGGTIQANDDLDQYGIFGSHQDLIEEETLSYRAVVAAAQQDIRGIAKEAVGICYKTYKETFDVRIARVKQRFAGQGASSAEQLMIIDEVKYFSEVIIAQLNNLIPQFFSGREADLLECIRAGNQANTECLC